MKATHGEKAALWAGGTDLLLQWQRGAVEFESCIDLSGLDQLATISSDTSETSIGALTTIASLAANGHIANTFPVLVEMAALFATPQIRHLATIGGNLCHAVPSADAATPLIALEAEIDLASVSGTRTLPLESFFTGAKQTELKSDEILTGIRVPQPDPRTACSFQKMMRASVDIALVSSTCRLTVDDDGRITRARIALGAVAPTPIRSAGAEGLLTGKALSEVDGALTAEVGTLAAADTRPITDVRTTAEYRRHASSVLTRRAVEQAVRSLQQ